MRSRAVWALLGGLAAGPAAVCQEPPAQVRIQVPEAVVFPVTDLRSKAVASPGLVTFDHALLAPGGRLRISVRAEGLDLGTGAPARISYAARARGGTAFSGSLRDTDYTPVFESDPLALSGSVEIAWTLEPLGRLDRSGNRGVALRWKVESITAPWGALGAGRFGREPGIARGAAPRDGAADDPGGAPSTRRVPRASPARAWECERTAPSGSSPGACGSRSGT